MLPYQWDVLNDRAAGEEPTHCAENFRIAAGELPGRAMRNPQIPKNKLTI